MSEAPERIWIEDEFGEGDDDQWTYGTWDVRNYAGYDVEYVRADLVQPDVRIKEYEEAYQYALHLAEALRKNYPPNPDFRFLGDLAGLLTQIDNMVAGLSQPADRIEALQASNLRLSGALYDMTAERDRLKAKIRFLERRALD